jgi:single-stranded DNA-specific DHH superfamily exonuclease
VDNLISLLNNNKGNPAIDDMIIQMGKVKAVFDKINIKTSDIKPEYNEAEKLTVLRSEVKSDLTPEVFRELSAVVSEIRNSFVK